MLTISRGAALSLSKRAFAEHLAEGAWPAQPYTCAAEKEEDPAMGGF